MEVVSPEDGPFGVVRRSQGGIWRCCCEAGSAERISGNTSVRRVESRRHASVLQWPLCPGPVGAGPGSINGAPVCLHNRLKNRIKIIYWTAADCGFCAKRLERGTFGWPTGEGASCSLRPEELQLLLHGLEGKPRRHWYRA